MTRLGIEPRSPRPLANTLTIMPMSDKSKVGDLSRRWPKGSIFSSYPPRCRGGHYSIPWIAPLYSWSILSVKQDFIKYHFLSLWYDSTWHRTPVSRAIGKNKSSHGRKRFWNLHSQWKQILYFYKFYTKKHVFDFHCLKIFSSLNNSFFNSMFPRTLESIKPNISAWPLFYYNM